MKHLFGILFVFSLASLISTAQNMKPNTEPNAKFSQMSDEFVKDSLALSPVSASQAGYHKHTDPKTGKTTDLDAQLDDVSAAGVTAQQTFYREWRKRFQTETPIALLNPQDAADFRLIDDQIGLNLLEYDTIQNYKHNPTVYVELLGSGLFLPLTQEYASKEVRVGDVISRIGQIPRFLDQAKSQLTDADPSSSRRDRRERRQHQPGRHGRRRHSGRLSAEGAVRQSRSRRPSRRSTTSTPG